MNKRELETDYKKNWESEKWASVATMIVAGLITIVIIIPMIIRRHMIWSYFFVIIIIWVFLYTKFMEAKNKLSRLKNAKL